jgi:phytoene dehydrogenase-like protein
MASRRDAVIIGAGHNGLVAAAYLTRAGLDVLVLERRTVPGGAASGEELFAGFAVSPCAHHLHLLQSRVARDLDLHRHGLSLQPMDPVYLSPYSDGRTLIQWRSLTRTQQEIGKFSARDAAAYPEWLRLWRRIGELLDPYTLSWVPPTVAELRRVAAGAGDEDLLDQLIHWPIRRLLDQFFESEQVQAALMPNSDTRSLDRPGELLGWAATAPNRGALPADQGLPVGGMGTFGRALLEAARGLGAEVRLGVTVQEIVVDEDRGACGVLLEDGTTVDAGVVLSNADPKRTFSRLVPGHAVPAEVRRAVDRLDTDSGSLKFHAAVRELPDLTAHLGRGHDPRLLGMLRVSPSTSYVEASLVDAAAGRPTDSPVLIVMIPTVYDPSVAPPGQHLVSMRVKFEPSRLRQGTWAQHREAVGNQVIDAFTEYAPNFRRSILDWVVFTPEDLEDRMALTDGNIHHLNHDPGQLLGDRLFTGGGYRTPVRNLYMCGAGTHPGGEVTGAPGHNAAHLVLEELSRLRRPGPGEPHDPFQLAVG